MPLIFSLVFSSSWKVVGTIAVAAAVIVAAIVAAPAILKAAGFTSASISAGSFAASCWNIVGTIAGAAADRVLAIVADPAVIFTYAKNVAAMSLGASVYGEVVRQFHSATDNPEEYPDIVKNIWKVCSLKT